MILSYTAGQGTLQLAYSVIRQAGSHLRLTTYEHGEHHLTIPLHSPRRLAFSYPLTQNPEPRTSSPVSPVSPFPPLPLALTQNSELPHVSRLCHTLQLRTQNSKLRTSSPLPPHVLFTVGARSVEPPEVAPVGNRVERPGDSVD